MRLVTPVSAPSNRKRPRVPPSILSPGQHGDCPRFIPLMEAIWIGRRGTGRPRTRPGAEPDADRRQVDGALVYELAFVVAGAPRYMITETHQAGLSSPARPSGKALSGRIGQHGMVVIVA